MKAGVLLGIAGILSVVFLLPKLVKGEAEKIIESAGMKPSDFTASVSQLDKLVAAGYPEDSEEYNLALDWAYDKTAKGCNVVGWSSQAGYYCSL